MSVISKSSNVLHAAPLTQSFACSRQTEYFTVPTDVYSIAFDIYGAADGWTSSYGARVTGIVAVIPGEELEIKVGCKGSVNGGDGGFPNGGRGGGIQGQNAASGGGGSSSIVADHSASYEVLAIAGGAGGSTNFTIGGAGGMNGDDAPNGWVNMRFMDGKGATQAAAGGQTCNLANYCDGAGSYLQGGESTYGGGGGGGYYGGGAGTGDLNYWWGNSYTDYSTAGGGGSSYVSPTRSNGFTAPSYYTGWSDGPGSVALSWTATPTTTLAPTSTAPAATISTTLPPATVSTTPIATTPASTTPPTVTTIPTAIPSWSTSPEVESELPVSGVSPFPSSGSGTVEVTNETGFVITKARAFIPKWRTRVYIGDFKFSIKATYIVNKKKKSIRAR